jgi:hypothetical protein
VPRLDPQAGRLGEPLGVRAELVPQRFRPAGVVEEPNPLHGQVPGQGLGVADVREHTGDHHPVKAGEGTRDLLRVPFKEGVHACYFRTGISLVARSDS